MNNRLNNIAIKNDNESTLDFQQTWNLFLANWRWFLISVLAFVLFAGAYLWFIPQKVNVNSRMQVSDKSKQSGQLSAGFSMLSSLPLGLGGDLGSSLGMSNSISTEEEILMSNALLCDVVNDLSLHTEYRRCSWGRRILLYKNQPVNVSIPKTYLQWLDDELSVRSHQIILYITKDNKGYTVETTLKENKEKTHLPDQTFATLPATINTGEGTLTLTENTFLSERDREDYRNGYTIKVMIVPPTARAMDFVELLKVEDTETKAPDIISITLEDENAMRGTDVVNHLIEVYNRYTNDRKNEEAEKTEDFVNHRLAKLDQELGTSDEAWEKSKKTYQITDPQADAQNVMQMKAVYETKLVEIGTQLQIHDYLSEYINNPDNLFEIIPVSFGDSGLDLQESQISYPTMNSASSKSSLIAQHNALVSQRKQLLRSMTDKSPTVLRLTETIKELHPSLQMAMKRERQNIIMKREAVEREFSRYMGRITSIPQAERVLTDIGRQREIRQAVYLMMLQKREETAMTLANTRDKGKLIDKVLVEKDSKHPKKKIVLLAAFFIGLIFPMPFIFFRQLISSRIESHADLKSIADYLYLGEISSKDSTDTACDSLLANLLSYLKDGQKVILIASDADGDGKTFVAQHLTEALSATGKKATSMNLDLRQTSMKVSPAVYLASSEFTEKINEARDKNDYIIVDSSSLGNYSDAFLIARYADATVFIVKYGSTHKAMVKDILSDTRIPSPMIAINTVGK